MTVDAGADAPAEAPPASRPRRSEQLRREKRRRTTLMTGYAVAVTVLALSIPVLGWMGARTILDSSDGEVVDPQLDPSEPGYQALVPPSPTLLVFQTDDEGALVGLVLLSLPSEDGTGGGVLLVPPATVAEVPELGPFPIDASFAFSGADGAKSTVEWALGIGIDDVAVVPASEWAEIVASTGTLTITNPDVLRDEEGDVVFPSGPLELSAEEVPAYAAFLSEDESRLNRLLRQEIVWRAWIERLEADPDAVVFPGEEGRGIARFLPAIVSGPHRIATIPLDAEGDAGLPGSDEPFAIDEEALPALLTQLVPFPAGTAAGDRPLVRLLSGTGSDEQILPAARRIVAAGGQVTIIGNADRFDYEETQVIYWDDAHRADAVAVAESLGFGTVIQVDEVDESADVVVVLGPDAASL